MNIHDMIISNIFFFARANLTHKNESPKKMSPLDFINPPRVHEETLVASSKRLSTKR